MRKKDHKTSPSNVPPINIILPESFYQTSYLGSSSARAPPPDMSLTPVKSLYISGPRDKLTDEYFVWQESQVEGPEQKAVYREARKVMKDHCIDVGLIYKDPNLKDLIDLGVKIGATKHIVSDIDEWKQSRKRPRTEEI